MFHASWQVTARSAGVSKEPATRRAAATSNSEKFRYEQWIPVFAAAGIERRRPYDCRHTFATWAIEAGVQLSYLATVMGTSVHELEELATPGEPWPPPQAYGYCFAAIRFASATMRPIAVADCGLPGVVFECCVAVTPIFLSRWAGSTPSERGC
jgi:hypothetical protein